MVTRLDAARYLTYKAAWLFDRGQDNAREAAEAKWWTTELLKRVVDAITGV